MTNVRSIRVFWNDVSSGWYNFAWDKVIFGRSVVHMSICEATRPLEGVPFSRNLERWRGDARLSIKNVRPHFPNPGDTRSSGGVEFYVESEWSEPLSVAIDMTVCDFPEEEFYVGYGPVF